MKTNKLLFKNVQWLIPLLLTLMMGWSGVAQTPGPCNPAIYSLEFTNNQYGPAGLIFCGNSVSGQVVVVNTGQFDNKGNFVPTTGVTIAYQYTFDNPNLPGATPNWMTPGGGGNIGVNLNNTYFQTSQAVWWRAFVTSGTSTCVTNTIAVYKTSVPGITGPNSATQPNPTPITGSCDAALPFGDGVNLTIATPIDYEVFYYIGTTLIASKPYGGVQSPLTYMFGYGTFTVTVVATNFCGTATSSFTVTTYDNTPPQLTGTLPTGQTGMNLCYANMPVGPTAAEIAAEYTDNCTGVYVDKTSAATGNDCGWTVTYTYDVYDGVGNHVSPSPTVVYSGSDQTAPTLTGTPFSDATLYNACYVDAYSAVPAWTQANAITGYSDNCSGPLTAQLTGTSKTGDDCGWTVTYTYTVYDQCMNSLVNQTYSHSGKDQTPPALTGTPYTDATLYNACYVNALTAVPAWTQARAIQGYTDVCGGALTATLTNTAASGNDCGWTVTYTYTVFDKCLNPLVSQTYVHNGKDQTAPSLTGTPYTDATLYNACYVNALTAVPAWTQARAIQGYSDLCGGALTATLTNTAASGNDCGWTVTYTYTVFDKCLNPLVSQTYVHNGKDQTPPALTGTPYTDGTLYNACYVNALTAVPAWTQARAIQGYTDACGGALTATLTNTVASGNDCGWTVTYTYSVIDKCGNALTGQTYVHNGKDQTPPALTGTPYTDATLYNACYVNALAAVPAWTQARAIQGYTDACGGTITATLTNSTKSGDDCGWTVTYTYTVFDKCGNALTGRTYVHNGKDQTPPVPDQPVPADENLECMSDITTPTMTGTDACGGTVTVQMVETIILNGKGCYNDPYQVERYWVYTDKCLNAFTSAIQTITVEADELICEIDEVLPADRPFCNTADNVLTATVTGGCDKLYIYSWSVVSLDNTWSIQSVDQATGAVTYTAGMVGDIATFTLLVEDENGCTTTCTYDLECQGGAYCTWTQGFYGNDVGQDCDGNSTTDLLNIAFGYPDPSWPFPITIGDILTNYLQVNSAPCVIAWLPAGGTAAALSGQYICPTTPINLSNNLAAQTLTLKINMNIGDNPGHLGDLVLPAGKDFMKTAEAVDCYNFESEFVLPLVEVSYYVEKSVTAYLNGSNGYTPDVNGLLALADAALAGGYQPVNTGDPTLLEITSMVDIINNAFHACRVITGWGNDPILPKLAQTVQESAELSMYPNPTTGNVTILIPEEGFTHIRVVGLDGKTIMEVPQTELDGQFQVTLHMQNAARGIYYVFAYNNDVVASKGKLVIVR